MHSNAGMACCAFAVFVLTQVLAPFVWLRRKLFGEVATSNAAVAWSPGAAAPAQRTLRWTHKTMLTAVALELLLGAAALLYAAPRIEGAAWIEAAAFDGTWCRSLIAGIEGRN